MQTDYVLRPRNLLSSLHQKTYFKAANLLALDCGCMNLESKIYNQQFSNITRNLKLKEFNEQQVRERELEKKLVSKSPSMIGDPKVPKVGFQVSVVDEI
jgi:hypothetical protein